MSIRSTYLLGLAVIILLLLGSLYVQVYLGIMPCPLCTLQRFTFGLLGFLFFIGILVAGQFWARTIINSLAFLTTILGIFLAGRQIWLQQFPTSVSNECGVSIQYMMQVLPLHQVIQKVFEGSAECTRQDWEFLHINMAEWAMIWFVLFFLLTVYLFLKELKWKH